MTFGKRGAESKTNTEKLSEKIERQKEIGKVFLKLGTLAFGGPAAHIAMMDEEIIQKRKWISRDKFMDLIGATNLIPGLVFTTVTFIGYLLKGFPGAIVATVGVFIPSFLLVWLLNPIIPKLRNSVWLSGILDGVNLASLALMTVVSLKLGVSSLIDPLSLIIFIVSAFALIKLKINPPWIIVLGGIIGFLSSLV